MSFLQTALAQTKGDRDAAVIKHLIGTLAEPDEDDDGIVF
jgi:hypothetical protein